MGWTTHNLAVENQAPLAYGAPSSYYFTSEETRHVFYLQSERPGSTNGHLTELYEKYIENWVHKDITQEAGAPLASSAPRVYVFAAEGTQHVVYLSNEDDHLHELYQDDGWHHNDLTVAAGLTVIPRTPPVGWSSVQGTQHVVFAGLDQHVHLLSRGTGDGARWEKRDLTWDLGGPPCVVAPSGYDFSPDFTMHVIHRGPDGYLYEYRQQGNVWSFAGRIGTDTPAPPAVDDAQVGYTMVGEGTHHVDFRSDDGNVHEFSFSGSWDYTNLTADTGAPTSLAGLGVFGYAFNSYGLAPVATAHVVYQDSNYALHELWRDPAGWHQNVLTSQYPPASAPSAFIDTVYGQQRVFYTARSGELIEALYTIGGQPPRLNVHPRR